MPTRAQREEVLRRERERFLRGPLDAAELAEFKASAAREMDEFERCRNPQPQLQLPEIA